MILRWFLSVILAKRLAPSPFHVCDTAHVVPAGGFVWTAGTCLCLPAYLLSAFSHLPNFCLYPSTTACLYLQPSSFSLISVCTGGRRTSCGFGTGWFSNGWDLVTFIAITCMVLPRVPPPGGSFSTPHLQLPLRWALRDSVPVHAALSLYCRAYLPHYPSPLLLPSLCSPAWCLLQHSRNRRVPLPPPLCQFLAVRHAVPFMCLHHPFTPAPYCNLHLPTRYPLYIFHTS
jgi:hypothetical protein